MHHLLGEGDHCFVDLLNADPATIDASDVDLVEDRQHSGAGSHKEGGRPQGKGSPRGCREDPPFCPPASTTSPACLHPFRGESPGRCSVEVPVNPGLAPLPQGVSPYISPQGSPPDRSLRRQAASTPGSPRTHRKPSTHSARGGTLSWPSSSLRFPSSRGLSGSWKGQGDISPCHPVLGCPDVVFVSPGASRGGRSPSSLQRQPHHRLDNRGASSKTGKALPSRLDDLRGYWGVVTVSDRSFSAGWKRSSEDRYERAWQSFKTFLRSFSIPLHQATLRSVLDYLTHLYDRGFLWSTIGIHRSTLSMMMAPIDGVRVGDHPLVKRLMSGVFNERPSRRANPALWDPLKVLSVFQHWPVDLPLSNLIRKGAFLMALTTAKRPSELVNL
jgi:hypothetical protein